MVLNVKNLNIHNGGEMAISLDRFKKMSRLVYLLKSEHHSNSERVRPLLYCLFPSFQRPLAVARLSTTSVVSQQRFGDHTGSSGWKWEKGGVGMGGKTSGIS